MSKIFAEVPFRKISAFHYTQNSFSVKEPKKLHNIVQKIPESFSRIIFRIMFLWVVAVEVT